MDARTNDRNYKFHNIFTRLGLRHDFSGYRYLSDFVKDYLSHDITESDKITAWYAIEAKRCNVKPVNVERNIRHLKDSLSKKCNDVELYKEIFGSDPVTNNLTSKEFLFTLCHYIML